MNFPQIDLLPAAPDSASPATFGVLAEALAKKLVTMVPQMNTSIGFLNTAGLVGLQLTFKTATADADPGAGCMRMNNALGGLASQLYIDNVEAGGGLDLAALIGSWDDSTNAVKGVILIAKASNPDNYIRFMVNGAVVAGAGYQKVPVMAAGGSADAPFADGDAVVVVFQRTGDTPAGVDRAMDGFRLTVSNGVAVPTGDVVGAGTLYSCPYSSNGIALWDGTKWVVRYSAQFSIALAALTVGRPYDVFVYDNAGAPAIELTAWTNDTLRATALAYQDGVLVKNGTPTRRYKGSIYTTGAASTEDSEANRYVWNYYNRVARSMRKQGNAATWTYASAAWRQANGSTANQLNFIAGVAEDAVLATVVTGSFNSTATARSVQVGATLNGTGAPTDPVSADVESARTVPMTATATLMPVAGRNFIAWTEIGAGTDTQTFKGTSIGHIKGTVLA